jgi:hypothetical protein
VQPTPLSKLKVNAPVNPHSLAPPPPAPKTDLTIEKQVIKSFEKILNLLIHLIL